jgi:hypothetical protein
MIIVLVLMQRSFWAHRYSQLILNLLAGWLCMRLAFSGLS